MDQKKKVPACSRVDSSNIQLTKMKIPVLRDMCVFGYLLFQRNMVPSSSTGSIRPRRPAVWQDTVTCGGRPGEVSSHFEYLENRTCGPDVTSQPVRGDLNVHPWTVTLPRGQSVGSDTPLTELVYCVTVFGATQSAVRHRWLSLCTVWTSHWQISSLSTAIFSFGKSQKLQRAKSGL